MPLGKINGDTVWVPPQPKVQIPQPLSTHTDHRESPVTSDDIRAQLEKKEQELEREWTVYKSIHGDIISAEKNIRKVTAKIADFRKANNEYRARSLETSDMLKAQEHLRASHFMNEEWPKKIKKLEAEVKALKGKLKATIASEKASAKAPKAKTATDEAAQRDTNSRQSTPKTVAGAKRKAADHPSSPSKRQKPEDSATTTSASTLKTRAFKPPTIRRVTVASQKNATQTGRGSLRPQGSQAAKSEAALWASAQTEQSSKAAEDQPACQKPAPPANMTGKAGGTKSQRSGSNSKVSKLPNATAAATTYSTTSKAGTKRKAMSDSATGSDSDNQKIKARTMPSDTDSDSQKPKRQKLEAGSVPRGLINHNLACFSNAVIQLLAAALEDYDIDALLGELGAVDSFDLIDNELFSFDTTSYAGEMPKGLRKKQLALRAAIKEAAEVGETDAVSVTKHLRKFIDEMHTGNQGGHRKAVSPYLLQSVVACGGVDGEMGTEARHEMNGDKQQDALEYFQLLVNNLIDDPHAADANTVKEMFQIETESTSVCADTKCDIDLSALKATGYFLGLDLPATNDEELVTLAELIEKSTTSLTDKSCEGKSCCGGNLTRKTAYTKVPDNLIVRVNRASFEKNVSAKVTDAVKLDKTLGINGTSYALKAVVMHKGRLDAGHYTAYRKHGETWYHLDDKRVIKEGPEDLAAIGERRGQPAMMLYVKV